jgi:hypothetical protein
MLVWWHYALMLLHPDYCLQILLKQARMGEFCGCFCGCACSYKTSGQHTPNISFRGRARVRANVVNRKKYPEIGGRPYAA